MNNFMNINVEVQENEQFVKSKIGGEIDAYTAPQVREALSPFAVKPNIHLTIDLTDVSYMDSTGLGVFVGLFKSIRANDGQMVLTGLSERLKRLFDITGLADIMEINSEVEGGV